MTVPMSLWRPSIPPGPKPTVLEIAEQVAQIHGLTLEEVLSPCRTRRIAHARQAAFSACRSANYTLHQIARRFDMDHTTVLHGDREHRRRLALREAAE